MPESGVGSTRLELPQPVVERMVAHARACVPEECCGILIGSRVGSAARIARRLVEARNRAVTDRRRRYLLAPRAILEAHREAQAAGLEIVGYYHSHPRGSAEPSDRDERDAWPDTSYVILGGGSDAFPEVRSWRLNVGGTGFVEETVIRGNHRQRRGAC